MKHSKHLLATTALVALLATSLVSAAHAEDAAPSTIDNAKLGFAQAIKDIQGWFGDDTPETIEPAAGTVDATAAADDEYLQVPTPVDPSIIEPAAGGMNDDVIQIPPPYMGPADGAAPAPVSSNQMPRATAFDNQPSTTAFGENIPSVDDIANIAPAAGDVSADTTAAVINASAENDVDCQSVLDAASNATESDDIDTALIEACESEAQNKKQPELAPAQPAFESAPIPQALPETQPASGEDEPVKHAPGTMPNPAQ